MYIQICEQIWGFHQENRQHLAAHIGGNPHVLIEPPTVVTPPRAQGVNTAILFVSSSPRKFDEPHYPADLYQMQQWLSRYEYVSDGPLGTWEGHHLSYNKFFKPLIDLVKQIEPRIGVWWQVQNNAQGERVAVEFTDFCHLPFQNDRELRALLETGFGRVLRAHCLDILRKELAYFHPKAVIANGVLASEALWEICTGQRFTRQTRLEKAWLEYQPAGWKERCTVHLSGFMTSARKLDVFSQARIAAEVKYLHNF